MPSILLALLIPLLGTVLGSAFVFVMRKEIPALLQKALLGFASGVMVAASVWSLLIPSIEMGSGTMAIVPAVIGLLLGFAFLLLIDYITPHIHASGSAEGPKSGLSKQRSSRWRSLFTIFLKEWRWVLQLPRSLSDFNIGCFGPFNRHSHQNIRRVPSSPCLCALPATANGVRLQ